MKTTPSFWFMLKSRLAGKSFLYEFYCKGKKILDVGCGEGYFLACDKENMYGFDLNKNAINRLASEGFHVQIADVGMMPYDDEEFDIVHCHNVIEHLYAEKAHTMLIESARVLVKGGLLLLSSEIITKKFWCAFEHTKPYPPGAIIKLINEKGKGEFGGLSAFEYAGLFYMGDCYKNKLLYLISAFLGFYTPFFRREYYLILRKK